MTAFLTLSTSIAGPPPPAQNEDAVLTGPAAAVVVDGAGLPQRFRAGCSHSVAWYARSLCDAFGTALADEQLDLRDALARAIGEVAAAHGGLCDLAQGSPSATVAALRIRGEHLEHLVLCDAACVLLPAVGPVEEVTDSRLDDRLRETAATGDFPDVSTMRTAANRAHRNRPGGFWVAQSDPAVAREAVIGSRPVTDLAGAVLVSDGAARGYRMLGAHSLEDFARRAVSGEHRALLHEIRTAERDRADLLAAHGEKPHDDASIVSVRLGSS